MMTEVDLKNKIHDIIDEIEGEALIEMWNACAQNTNRPVIYSMDEIEKVLLGQLGMSLLDVIGSVDSDRFYSYDEFFTIDNMEYIVTFSDLYEVSCPFDTNALVDYIVENAESFGDPDIQNALDEFYAESSGEQV